MSRDIEWAPGMEYGLPLLPEHDLFFVRQAQQQGPQPQGPQPQGPQPQGPQPQETAGTGEAAGQV